eukprot:scaffold786_cov329-Pavlova_lutheri.AAC.3
MSSAGGRRWPTTQAAPTFFVPQQLDPWRVFSSGEYSVDHTTLVPTPETPCKGRTRLERVGQFHNTSSRSWCKPSRGRLTCFRRTACFPPMFHLRCLARLLDLERSTWPTREVAQVATRCFDGVDSPPTYTAGPRSNRKG